MQLLILLHLANLCSLVLRVLVVAHVGVVLIAASSQVVAPDFLVIFVNEHVSDRRCAHVIHEVDKPDILLDEDKFGHRLWGQSVSQLGVNKAKSGEVTTPTKECRFCL